MPFRRDQRKWEGGSKKVVKSEEILLIQVIRVLERCLEMYLHCHIRPIQPVAIFEASEIELSFRYLQKGVHIGKAVVKMPEDTSNIPSAPHARALTLNPEASYLLTGGLGGLGRAIAIWMVEHGARYLTFLSRSAGLREADEEFFTELESLGCSVCAVAGKVQDIDDLNMAISKSATPIKGVIHLAMVLRVCSSGFPSIPTSSKVFFLRKHMLT
jgi:KR domain